MPHLHPLLPKTHPFTRPSFLAALDIADATAEFERWPLAPQARALASLDTFTAASIAARLDADARRELLTMLEPDAAANIMQAMLPPPAAQSLGAMDAPRASAVLEAMDPGKVRSCTCGRECRVEDRGQGGSVVFRAWPAPGLARQPCCLSLPHTHPCLTLCAQNRPPTCSRT